MGLIASGLYEVGRSWHGAMHQEVDFVDRTITRDGVDYMTWYTPIDLNKALPWKNWSFTYEDIKNVEARPKDNGEEGDGLLPISDFIQPAPVDPKTGLPEGCTRDAEGRIWIEYWCYPREPRRHAVFRSYD